MSDGEGRGRGWLPADGLRSRKGVLQLVAVVCVVAAVMLLAFAAVLASQQKPAKQPLRTGVVFNVPLSPSASPAVADTASPEPEPVVAQASTTPESTPQPAPSPEPTAAPAAPTPAPTPPPSDAPIARLVIPQIRVNAPVNVKGVDAHGVMQDPNSWNDVAYYDFSGYPGFGGGNNAVFAGHVDYIRHGPAVFWDLDKLNSGDQIHVQLNDGTEYVYRVTSKAVYGADNAPVAAILGSTSNESVTLITCNGTFAAGHYNDRLIVRAERLS